MSPQKPYPHEKRVQRYGYLALGVTVGLAFVLAFRGDSRMLGLQLPLLLPLALILVGAIVGAVAVNQRKAGIALPGAGLLVLGILPAGTPQPNVLDYALGFGFGLALLLFGELVHMTLRYERAHRAVDHEGVPEEHVNTVTDEALKTLATRSGLALALCAAGVAIAFALSLVGPRQWRAALETTAPVGVTIATAALFGALALYILVRGSDMGALRRRSASSSQPPQESAADVAE